MAFKRAPRVSPDRFYEAVYMSRRVKIYAVAESDIHRLSSANNEHTVASSKGWFFVSLAVSFGIAGVASFASYAVVPADPATTSWKVHVPLLIGLVFVAMAVPSLLFGLHMLKVAKGKASAEQTLMDTLRHECQEQTVGFQA